MRYVILLLAFSALVLAKGAAVCAPGKIDLSLWQQYRGTVQHPATTIKPADLERARRNQELYPWARAYVQRLRADCDRLVERISPAYLQRMVERTSPGCTGPCPACRAKGLPWHPNGQWSWSEAQPDQLTCRVCRTVFPHPDFPEEVVLQSKWDPEQKFTFVGGEPFNCFGYLARPSLSGIIRERKLNAVTSHLHTLALGYALTGDPRFAQAARLILLRFAEVLPRYLVRAGYGYGETADCDPRLAAEHILNLPTDELVVPPNKPDRRLHTGYWSASRIGSSGMDGGWVSRVALAYDLTCTAQRDGAPVYSPAERERIERDVLLESAYLAVCDPAINNKSVGNRTGAAVVGMCVGHPELVRFGLDGFRRTVEEWFLPDGGTSESAAYALMTMGGVRDFALLLRDYTEPEGYAGPDGKHIERFNAFRDTRYGDCWQGLIWTLQGDLRYPPSADSYQSTTLSGSFAELIALGYPTPEHLALLKERAGADTPESPAQAILYREPGIEKRETPPLSLPDVLFPFLLQGHLRTGSLGRDSLALLSAREWGNHHHLDSLDLYYWANGRELLSDLGYLWDHPDKYQTARTFAHNTVLLDGRDQISRGRQGTFHLFGVTPRVKVMEASAKAYEAATVYRRTVVQVDHGAAGSYLVDVFRAQGGGERQYLFHGPNNDFQVEGLDLAPTTDGSSRPVAFALRFHLPQLGEILVSDVEVVPVLPGGREGANLAPPLPAGLPDGAKPAGWGCYLGDGTAEWGMATVEGRPCVRFRATQPHANGRVNVALMVGDSDGYTGQKALRGAPETAYRVRFRLRGNAPLVNVEATAWLRDPASPADRSTLRVAQVSAEPAWRSHQATFTLPANSLPLKNVRQAAGASPWRATWRMDEGYTFSAFSPGGEGEQVVIGDGWGQRDHRNTDRGATLPYLLRVRSGNQLDTFVSVFAGAPAQRPLVQGVRRLPLPEGTPPGAVLLEVRTALGPDLVYSTLTPVAMRVATPGGELATDGAVAVALGGGRGAALFGGTQLSLGRTSLSLSRAAWSGRVLGAFSEAGSSWFRLEGALPPAEGLAGQTLFVTAEGKRRGYPIRRVEGDRVYTKWNGTGFEARAGDTWEVVSQAAWQG